MSTANSVASLTDSVASSGSSTSTSGFGQGINVQQFVQFALANQQATITALQTQQSTLTSQTTELSKISSDMSALDNAVFALTDPLGVMSSLTTATSNASVVSAAASSTATAGTHSVTVNSLATTASYYTDPLSSSTATISSGTFNIAVGSGSPIAITVNSSNNTLGTLAASINSQDAGVTASVVQDANGYRLALVSNTTGTSGNITISGNTTSLNFNPGVTGTNASLVVDGIPISSSSNTVSNVINGVTLNLGSASPNTPITVNVGPDTTSITNAINTFVGAYNTVVGEINSQFAVASDGSGGGPLEADNTLRDVQTQLLGAISYSSSGNGGIVNLASMGINMNNDGTLTVDNTAVSNALASNISGVQSFLQNATTGFAQNLSTVLSNVNSPATGLLSIDAQSITSTSHGISSQLADLQASLAVQQANLTAIYSQVNATLQELPMLQSQISQQLAGIP